MFNLIDDIFGNRNWFDRPFYESNKYKVYKDNEKNCEIIVANTLGIAKEDLVLHFSEEDKTMLELAGETDNPIMGASSIKYAWKVNVDVIDSIDMEVKDGFTYITLNKKQIKNEIAINRK
jgi:hypothetical protein